MYRILHLEACCDRDGRPLGEGKVPFDQRPPGIPFDMRACPYSGARSAVRGVKPMNTSAMKRVLGTLPDAFGAFLYLRERFFAPLHPIRFLDLWRLSMLAVALPRFLLGRRLPAMASGELPNYIADISKFSAGVNSLMLELALREATGAALPDMTTEGLFELADEMLVGEREVCAASPALVKETLSAFTVGAVGFKTRLPEDEALPLDLAPLFDFAAAYSDEQMLRWLLTALHDGVVYDIAGGQTGWRPAGEAASAGGGLSMLAAIRSAILYCTSADRMILVMTLAGKILCSESPSRDRLLQGLRRALESLSDQTASPLTSQLPETMRAANRYLGFRVACLDVLSTLESSLRVPLGLPPASRAPLLTLFTAVLGCSMTNA